jgi:hypothetical protein
MWSISFDPTLWTRMKMLSTPSPEFFLEQPLLNARSLLNKWNEFTDYLFLEHDLDVMAFTETWL